MESDESYFIIIVHAFVRGHKELKGEWHLTVVAEYRNESTRFGLGL